MRFKTRIRPHDAAVVSFFGRGVEAIAVTNPTQGGPGRFPAAVMAPGPPMLVFRVSGYAALEPELKIRELFLTIAGQTAPGDGTCIRNYRVNFDTSQVILRHLRSSGNAEPGPMDHRNNVVNNRGFNRAGCAGLRPRNWIASDDKSGPATDDAVRSRIFCRRTRVGKSTRRGMSWRGFRASAPATGRTASILRPTARRRGKPCGWTGRLGWPR